MEVVGHSFGAFLLQASLLAHPPAQAAVRKLVLVSMGGLYPHLHRGWSDLWRTFFWGLFFRIRLLGGSICLVLRYVPLLLAYAPELRCIAGAAPGELLLSNCVKLSWLPAWGVPAAPTLATLNLPLALVWGDQDPLFPCWQAREFACSSAIPFLSLAGCGHQPLFEPQGRDLLRLALLRAAKPGMRD